MFSFCYKNYVTGATYHHYTTYSYPIANMLYLYEKAYYNCKSAYIRIGIVYRRYYISKKIIKYFV